MVLQRSGKGGCSAGRAHPRITMGLCRESPLLSSPILRNSVCWKLVWGFLRRLSWWEQQVFQWRM